MFLCPMYLLYSTEVLFNIYHEYAQLIQGYQWWIYRQDIGGGGIVQLVYEVKPFGFLEVSHTVKSLS